MSTKTWGKWLAIQLVLLFNLSSSISSEYVGNLQGNLRIEQGQAVYPITIELPQGPNNIQPNLNLVYSSGGGNGPVGLGWSFDLLSDISRCPQTIAQDGKVKGVQYDNEDRFCLDGQRLVVVKGTYGADQSEYRTEVDTYSKIVASGQHGDGPESFTVWTKDGRIVNYGTTRSTQIIGNGASCVHQWNLAQINDRSGNSMHITYMTSSTSPSMLSYGTTSVVFKYDNRPDELTTYFNGGILTKRTQRITNIEISNPSGTIRQYMLDYHNTGSGGSSQSLLSSVSLCDATGECLKPIRLDYGTSDQLVESIPVHQKAIDYFGASTWSVVNHPRFIKDANGDGLTDIIGFQSNCVTVALNDGQGEFNTPQCWVNSFGTASGGWNGANHPRMVEDIDGDGLPDVVGFANTGVFVSFNTGSSFKNAVHLLRTFGQTAGGWHARHNHLRFVQDVNGDGKADIVGFSCCGIQVALSKGQTFAPVTTWSTDFGTTTNGWSIANHPRFLIDVNGDNLPDVVGFASNGVYVALNTGNSFTKAQLWLANAYHYNGGWRTNMHPRLLEDINGDGLVDIMGFGNSGGYVSFGTGTSFTAPLLVLNSFAYSTSPAYRVASHPVKIIDMTGDGLPDVVGFHNDGVYISLNKGTGTFASPVRWCEEFDYNNGWRVNMHPRDLVDINGDGVPDIIGFANDGTYVSINANRRPIIQRFTDGFSSVQSVSYRSLPASLHFGNYNKTVDVKYPIQSPVPPTYVVRSVIRNQGTPAANSSTYIYGDLRHDVSGRGQLGFGWVKEIDDNNQALLTERHQVFPLTGKIGRRLHTIQKHDGEDGIISDTLITYTNTLKSSVHEIMPDTQVVESYEVDGKKISRMETHYTGSNGYGDTLEITSETSGGGETFTKKTVNTYHSTDEMWLVGQLVSSKVTHECSCLDPIIRHVTYEYDAQTGYILRQTIEPHHDLALVTNFKYDQFGNVITKTETPIQHKGKFRTVSTTFDEYGIFKKISSNGKGHTETYDYDESSGNLKTLTGGNGLKTKWTYDMLGRKVQEHQDDGTIITWSYNWDNTVPGAVYNVKMESVGSPTKIRVYDALDRVICDKSVGFDGSDIHEDMMYNKEGLLHKHSYPHFVSETPRWRVYLYDILGRLTYESSPGTNGADAEHHITYNGMTGTKTNALGHSTSLAHDVYGRLIQVTDHIGGTVHYTHDSVGNVIQTKGPDGLYTKIEYDILGHKSEVDDPNMGLWRYRHNAFGELIWQEDANQNVLTQEYDALGRLVKRSEPEGVTLWTYDNQPHGIGKIGHVEGPGTYNRTWYYDEYGRENKLITEIQDGTFDIITNYDKYGRIIQQKYPNGEYLHRQYTSRGYLREVGIGQESTSSKPVWKALAYDALGRLQKEQHGNGLITEYVYDSTHLVGITTHKDGENTLRSLHYKYDLNENLLSRQDLIQEVSEEFAYDKLDRLIRSTVVAADGAYQRRQNWDYENNGNIRFNDAYGLGQFMYNRDKPHAVRMAGNHTYAYDSNGNAVLKDGKAIHWTSYNKPSQFDTVNGKIMFRYGPDRSRYMKISENYEKTLYFGKTYEVTTTKDTSTTKVFVYGSMGRLVAIVSRNNTSSDVRNVLYVHTDNLGSIDTISHENNTLIERLNYDAYGTRRSGDWKVNDYKAEYSVRGYTGHEHLPELGLIHMNGRVYDPEIGRFLSPDPHVQDPTNTQALNRYSYALNNPLKHNDPSGYFWKRLKQFVKKNWRPILAVAVSVATAGAAMPIAAGIVASAGISGLAATVATGALAGAVSGFAGGTVASGNLKGGLQGAAGGALFGGIAGYFGNTWSLERVATQATAGGIVSELGGGKFKDGFARAGLAAGARFLYNNIVQYDIDPKPGGMSLHKSVSQRPIAGANNIGIQGNVPDSAWIDRDQFLGINWGEGGGISRLLNRIPGVNAVAGLHDVMQVEMDKILFPGARNWFNVPGMLPAAAISYMALRDGTGMPALLVDQSQKD